MKIFTCLCIVLLGMWPGFISADEWTPKDLIGSWQRDSKNIVCFHSDGTLYYRVKNGGLLDTELECLGTWRIEEGKLHQTFTHLRSLGSEKGQVFETPVETAPALVKVHMKGEDSFLFLGEERYQKMPQEVNVPKPWEADPPRHSPRRL